MQGCSEHAVSLWSVKLGPPVGAFVNDAATAWRRGYRPDPL